MGSKLTFHLEMCVCSSEAMNHLQYFCVAIAKFPKHVHDRLFYTSVPYCVSARYIPYIYSTTKKTLRY